MIEQLKAGLIGLVIGGILAFAGGWWVRGYEVKALKAEIKVEKEANETNQATIKAKTEEIRKAAKSCNARIENKDRTLKRLKMIEGLNTGGKNEDGNATVNGDPVLDELNRMRKTTRQN